MKIIQVVGRSGSGKTTFVIDLIRAFRDRGTVAAVKHIGHHAFELDERKDTTRFAEAGAAVSVGVDSEKSVYIARSTELAAVLSTLCCQGVAYAVIEGFKTHPFPKVVIGDLEIEGCVLRNPSVTDVLASLDRFDEYVTIPGIVRELELAGGAGMVAVTWSSSSSRRNSNRAPWRRLVGIEREMQGIDGMRAARVYVAPEPESESGGDSLSIRIGAVAVDGDAALRAIATARELLARQGKDGDRTGD